MVSTGGTSLKDDIMRLESPVHVLVGTPGRILDLSSKGIADISSCPTFVMDEADKLLSPEFTGESLVPWKENHPPCPAEPRSRTHLFAVVIEQILALMPKGRQMMLFSATFPLLVKDFKVRQRCLESLPNVHSHRSSRGCQDKHMVKPYEINLMDELTLRGVSQFYAFLDEKQKVACLNTLFARVRLSLSLGEVSWCIAFRLGSFASSAARHQPIHHLLQLYAAC